MTDKILTTFVFIISLFAFGSLSAAAQQDKNGEAAAASNLLETNLPGGAARLGAAAIPAEFHQLLTKFVEGGGARVKQGKVEVLVWAGADFRKSKAARLIQNATGNLKNAGWNYEVAEQRDDLTLFTVSRAAPKKRAAVGFWAANDDALVFALTEMLPADDPTAPSVSPSRAAQTNQTRNDSTASADAVVFNLAAGDESINVMGSRMPQMPQFPALPKKPGKARGYVKDLASNPLEGAYIGVRSTAVGGFIRARKRKPTPKAITKLTCRGARPSLRRRLHD